MHAELLILRVLHILGGIFWLGSGLFSTFFLLPALSASGPVGGTVMVNLQKRRLFLWMPLSALVTILAGLRLLWIITGGDMHVLFRHTSPHIYFVSGLLAIISLVLSAAVTRPSVQKAGSLAQMAASDAPSRERIAAEIERQRRRVTWSSYLGLALLVLAAIGMSVARYL